LRDDFYTSPIMVFYAKVHVLFTDVHYNRSDFITVYNVGEMLIKDINIAASV